MLIDLYLNRHNLIKFVDINYKIAIAKVNKVNLVKSDYALLTDVLHSFVVSDLVTTGRPIGGLREE